VVCGSPKLPSHFPGEDRRDYARAGASFLLLYFVCCLALEEEGAREREAGKRGDREGWTSDTGERKIKWLDFRTTGMDTGAPESGYRERSKFRRATSREGEDNGGWSSDKRRRENRRAKRGEGAEEDARRRMAEETISAPMTKGGRGDRDGVSTGVESRGGGRT